MAAYWPSDEWPLERMKRSRSGQSGSSGRMRRMRPYRAARMSAAESGPPTWPTLTRMTVRTTATRMRRAMSSSRTISSAVAPPAAAAVVMVGEPFSYEPGTTGGEKKHTSSSGSGPSDSVACGVPTPTQTVTPASISALPSGVTMRPRPASAVDGLLLRLVDVPLGSRTGWEYRDPHRHALGRRVVGADVGAPVTTGQGQEDCFVPSDPLEHPSTSSSRRHPCHTPRRRAPQSIIEDTLLEVAIVKRPAAGGHPAPRRVTSGQPLISAQPSSPCRLLHGTAQWTVGAPSTRRRRLHHAPGSPMVPPGGAIGHQEVPRRKR